MKIDWKRKLTSRKLWMALAGLVSGLVVALGGTEAAGTQISGLILSAASVIAYIVGEGLVDAAGAGKEENYFVEEETKPPEEEDDLK